MRIKWNRHLDGSSSRRQEDGTGTQETDEKKNGASSSPSIFKIFRRKKSRRRCEDDKTEGNNDIVPPSHSEADDDECASVSSVATSASQTVTEGFHRDRASSLFSSFRLSLPGSKRKKRRIAPTPSETLLNGQQSEPQIERYSTPDLRKPSDKLDAPSNGQVNLSTSSPSIRNPKGASTSAQSLDAQNSESLDKLKWSKAKSVTSSTSKLNKSVSFSDCKGGLTDASHSMCDNKALRVVNSTTMVEENSGALESELSSCMSDNLRMSRESKFTADGDSHSFAVDVSSFQKQPNSKTVGAVVMTKTEAVSNRNSEIIKKSAIADISHILDDKATEIQSYKKANSNDGICRADSSLQGSLVTSVNCKSVNYHNGYDDEAVTDGVNVGEKNKRYEVRVDLKKYPSVQCFEVETDVSSVLEQDTQPKRYDNYSKNILYPEKNKNIEKPEMDKTNKEKTSLNNGLDVLTSELSVLTTAKNLSKLNCDTIQNYESDVNDDLLNRTKYEVSDNSPVEKQSAVPSSKHLVCHVRIYENEPSADGSKAVSDNSLTFENPVIKNYPISMTHDNVLKKDISVLDNCQYETKTAERNIISSSENKSCFDSRNRDSPSKCDSLLDEYNVLNLCSEDEISCDQKVPDNELHASKNLLYQNDQQVPGFELSLMEFEDVCNKYMSHSNPEFSDCNSTIPLYSSSPKRKSVLDINFPFIYPNFQSNDNTETYLLNAMEDNMSFNHSDLFKQNINVNSHPYLQNSCQNLTEKYPLPSPPKQWINYEKSIDIKSSRDVCTDGVQCTNVRGKNLCQEPCLEALPTTVMLDDSDLGGIDTPQLSSTLLAFENKSGRECNSSVTGKNQQLFDDRTSSEDMVSNVDLTISTLSGVLDYSYVSETPGKSVFLDSEIRDAYRGPRAICDPLVYSTEVRKGLESLGTENYLNGHNFCDIRNVGFCEIISDVSRDYVQAGNGLIEISNPYEDSFILPQDLSNRNLVNDKSVSLPNGHLNSGGENSSNADYDDLKISVNNLHQNHDAEIPEKLKILNNDLQKEKFSSVDIKEVCKTATEKLRVPELNGKGCTKNKLAHVEHKNLKNKNSMIPCRKKGTLDNENKRTENKLKSKKSNSLPRLNKSESHLPVKNNSSHRVLSNSYKDSDAEQLRGKRQDLSVNKSNGNCSGIFPVNISCETSEISTFHPNLLRETITICEDSGYYVTEKNKTSSSYSMLEETSSGYSNDVINLKENNSSSFITNLDPAIQKYKLDDSKNILSVSGEIIPSIRDFETQEHKGSEVSSLKYVEIPDNTSECAVSVKENNNAKYIEEFCPECLHLSVPENVDIPLENIKYQCSNHSVSTQRSRHSSFSATGMRKTNFTSSKESLNSQLTNNSSSRGKSRIPRKQPGTRGTQPSVKGPVRPPMWLSKAELTQEIQRLGTLCEARTKELNRLKMETKHVSMGFDAFAALFKFMVEDLNGLSVPALTEDLEKTLKQLELTKQDLAYYEREVEEMKSHHCQELNDLSNKLFEVYQSEVAELNAKHQEEINHLKSDHQKQIEQLTATFDSASNEAKVHHEKMIASLEQEIINQREELQQFQEREIKDLEEKHTESTKLLQDHIEQLQKKCAELKQHSMSMEDAMRKDTDSKLQWVSAAKLDLEKEVESLKTVLEMKNKELHTLRVQNLEMEKQLEELPFAREKIKMLQARAEDLEALMIEKTKIERKLSTENQQIKDTYEKEAKVNRRLSMENEELQWRLRQAENSLISGSFTEVPEFPEAEENLAASPTKSPGPQLLSRSVFFTFVDKDESSPHSPRSQYKKITPNFSANYKTSPAKSSKSPPAPSPRRGKSHSEPPQPTTITSTPKKVAKQPLSKTKASQKRQRSGSDSARPSEHTEVNFTSVTESMASSVSSESSVFEHRERLLEEHKEHIIQSLEILREQRSTESSVDESTAIEKKWCSDDIQITGELSNLETENMSRSAEFADPKTYYHMTFPVLKESGITDCDIEDGCKNSSSGNSPMKEVMPNIMHSMSENNIHNAVETSDSLQVMSVSSQEVSTTVVRIENKRNSCTESTLSAENVQRDAVDGDKTENRWRTI